MKVDKKPYHVFVALGDAQRGRFRAAYATREAAEASCTFWRSQKADVVNGEQFRAWIVVKIKHSIGCSIFDPHERLHSGNSSECTCGAVTSVTQPG